MATKEQRELAEIYCSLTDLHEALDLLRDGLVNPKHLKSKDFKAVKNLKKPSKVSKYMKTDEQAENEEQSTWLWLSWHMSRIAQATQELRQQVGGF
jgi:hypothetical protein